MVQDASAFLDQELDKLENALISKRLPSDEVALSSGVGRQFAQIAMGLLEQEPGFRAAEGEPLIPFNEEQCYRHCRIEKAYDTIACRLCFKVTARGWAARKGGTVLPPQKLTIR